MTPAELARMIDHTELRPAATRHRIEEHCREAREHGFVACCVAPTWVALAVDILDGSETVVASVAGFPHGDTLSTAKAVEAARAMEQGAREIDMVLPIGRLRSGDYQAVLEDIRAVVEAVKAVPGGILKVILETAYLTDDEKIVACELAEKAGADFVKTSTGFAGGGATVADVALMHRVVGDRLGVKAAGGIRDLATAQAMIHAGASRLGTSSGVAILGELRGGS